MVEFTRKEYNIIAKNRGIKEPQSMSTQELTNTLTKYDSRCKVKNNCKKLSKIGLGKIVKKMNQNQVKKLQRKSTDELKRIARLRRIKNSEKLTKEEPIIALLKYASSALENNFMKQFNNTNDDDTYDDKR